MQSIFTKLLTNFLLILFTNKQTEQFSIDVLFLVFIIDKSYYYIKLNDVHIEHKLYDLRSFYDKNNDFIIADCFICCFMFLSA